MTQNDDTTKDWDQYLMDADTLHELQKRIIQMLQCAKNNDPNAQRFADHIFDAGFKTFGGPQPHDPDQDILSWDHTHYLVLEHNQVLLRRRNE